RLADDVAHRHKTPIAAVTRVVAIVTHDKELAFRHNGWPPAFQWIVYRRVMHRVWFRYRLRIYIQHTILYLKTVTAKSGHTLEESFLYILWVAEDDNIAATDGLQHGQAPMDERNLRSIEQLVHKKMIAHQDGAFHGRRGHHG